MNYLKYDFLRFIVLLSNSNVEKLPYIGLILQCTHKCVQQYYFIAFSNACEKISSSRSLLKSFFILKHSAWYFFDRLALLFIFALFGKSLENCPNEILQYLAISRIDSYIANNSLSVKTDVSLFFRYIRYRCNPFSNSRQSSSLIFSLLWRIHSKILSSSLFPTRSNIYWHCRHDSFSTSS